MAYEVFISYSKQDKSTADAVCGTLEAGGVRCWIAPRDVEPGCDWSASIISALNVVRVMVLVFSSHANASPHVRREVQRAFGKNVTVIPFRVEAVKPAESLEYYLGPVHWLDALTPPLDRHLQQLADTVQRVLHANAPRTSSGQPVHPSAPSPTGDEPCVAPPPRVDTTPPPRTAPPPPPIAPRSVGAAPAPARRSAGLILGLSAIGALTVVGLAFVFLQRGNPGLEARDEPDRDDALVMHIVPPASDEADRQEFVPLTRDAADRDESQPAVAGSAVATRDLPPEMARMLAEMMHERAGGISPPPASPEPAPPDSGDRIVWQDQQGGVLVTTMDGRVVDETDAIVGRDSRPPVPMAPAGAAHTVPVVGRDWTIPSLGLEMVYLYPDTFTLGSPASEAGRGDDEGPPTRVTLSEGFWLGRFEVTRQQWMAVMGPLDEGESPAIDPETPVTLITGNEALEFCRKLTAQERAARRLLAGFAYTLPSEAQWEYACRAGTTTPFHGGRGLGASLANIDGSQPYGGAVEDEMSDGPIPVGNYPPNDWGFFDMHGNVWEWTASAYTRRYPGGSVDDYDNSPNRGERTLRGGSWRDPAAGCRSAVRLAASANVSVDTYGFRLALKRER